VLDKVMSLKLNRNLRHRLLRAAAFAVCDFFLLVPA